MGKRRGRYNSDGSFSYGEAGKVVAEYEYFDQDNRPYLCVKRTEFKAFFQYHWEEDKVTEYKDRDGLSTLQPGGWEPGAPKGPKIPYRLPELIKVRVDEPVFICEGEKDTDNVRALGLTATTNSGGSMNWSPDLNQWFKDRVVVVLPDHDEPQEGKVIGKGEEHARDVSSKLRDHARAVHILRLPLELGEDASDWIKKGGTKDELLRLLAALSGSAASSSSSEGDAAEVEARPPGFSDIDLALRFADRHETDLRFVAAWGKWFRFDGVRWAEDTTLHARDLARKVCQAAAAGCNKDNIAKAVASAKTVAAVENLAKADRRIAATTEQWDADPWLLNTPDGVIDLRTSAPRPHDPADYITKVTAVGPSSTSHPLWSQFLNKVTGEDAKLEKFLQRVAGYVLTGLTKEQALFFAHGLGANGKSVFIGVLAGVIGDYHRTATIETFTASSTDRHPTELAGLRGARLVTAVETEEGRRWAESRIKMLTGGEKVSARFMRQDFFEFTPQLKLIIAGNHKPGLRSVDEAIRRRFHLIPFDVTIPPGERDADLAEKLRTEWPAILAWMIEGCREWQDLRLAPPESVVDATAAYIEGEDAVAAWIDDCCGREEATWSAVAALYESFRNWADRSGEFVLSKKRFSQKLTEHGFAAERGGGASSRGFRGLRVMSDGRGAM